MSNPGARTFHAILVDLLAESLEGPLGQSTPRRVHGRLTLPGKATAVIGMRRCGKTTLVHQIRRERLAAGARREALPFLSFEDERLAGIGGDALHPILEEYYRRHPGLRGRTTVTWCFDEIQAVPGWERFVRRLLDTEKVEVFVTGSSAALLSKEIATALRGRAWTVTLHPFSFEEALRHGGHEVPARPGALTAAKRSALERAFLAYLTAGGFPEAQGLDPASRHRLLMDYLDVAMLRDVVERHGVTNVTGLRWLVRRLLGNAASLFSVEKFYSGLKSQGISISKDTVHQLLAHLDDCFLVRTAWIEASSERQRMVNPRKAYPVDPALIPLFDRTGRPNLGHALETAVMLELERRGCAITYVRTPEGHEVDFLARPPAGGEDLIQVSADATATETMHRELRALDEAGRVHASATKRLLVLTRAAMPRDVPAGVIVQPAYEWMLEG